MSTLINTFANNLLPILLISAAGFTLGKVLKVDPRPLGRVIFYILSPVLVFKLLVKNPLPADRIGLMMGYSVAVISIVGGLAYVIGRLLHLKRTVLTAVMLTSLCGNSGNYGLPLVSFAFGQEALAYASIYFVTSLMLSNTVGVLIASLGHSNWKQAVLGLLKVPAIYAIAIALVIVRMDWLLPLPLDRTITLAADATIPVMIVLLGLELSRAQWSRQHLGAISVTSILRLFVGPLIGIGLAGLYGMQNPARQAGITEAGMPSAVLTTVLASEYRVEPSLVTTIVFVTTLLSPLTLTPLLVYLGK